MTGPRSLRTLLSGWHPAGERAGPGGEAGALGAAWAEAVGADVARRTRTSTFRDGSLTVITPSSAWSHQLTFLAPTIIERLQASCPGVGLRRLKFVVATGRSRALLARDRGGDSVSHARARGRQEPRPQEAGTALAGTAAGTAKAGGVEAAALDAPLNARDDLENMLARLRAEQQRLDARRARDGWVRCGACGRWSPTSRCEPCAQEARRAADARIASALAGTPWLRRTELAQHVPDADQRSFERVRRVLLAAWQQQLFNARARLRRGALEAADRVIAWSYAMLFTQRRKDELSDAMLANVLDRDWADALRGPPNAGVRQTAPSTASVRKARRPTREK
jgi:hypothetical protein